MEKRKFKNITAIPLGSIKSGETGNLEVADGMPKDQFMRARFKEGSLIEVKVSAPQEFKAEQPKPIEKKQLIKGDQE